MYVCMYKYMYVMYMYALYNIICTYTQVYGPEIECGIAAPEQAPDVEI